MILRKPKKKNLLRMMQQMKNKLNLFQKNKTLVLFTRVFVFKVFIIISIMNVLPQTLLQVILCNRFVPEINLRKYGFNKFDKHLYFQFENLESLGLFPFQAQLSTSA